MRTHPHTPMSSKTSHTIAVDVRAMSTKQPRKTGLQEAQCAPSFRLARSERGQGAAG
jgi:hypothetical protein